VNEGAFRQDLYFRLNMIQITMPPLRERIEDIPPLSRFFIEHYNRKIQDVHRRRQRLCDEVASLPCLAGQRAGTAQRHRARHDSGRTALITSSSLPIDISCPGGHALRGTSVGAGGCGEWSALEVSERRLLARALEQASGNQTEAARLLRISRDTLRYKKRKLSLA